MESNCKFCNSKFIKTIHNKKYCSNKCSIQGKYISKKNNPSYKRTNQIQNLKKNFNISIEEYNQMLVNQNGLCLICGKHYSEFKRNLAVDHCHITGKIRGLLCINCNRGLGAFEDNIQFLQNSINYINKF